MVFQFPFRPVKALLWILPCLILAGLARVQDRDTVFVGNSVFFTDADCYSRMSRVGLLLEQSWMPVRHHGFENHPGGVDSHATAPMDYCIALVGRALQSAGGWEQQQAMDCAGAWLGPVLGVLTALALSVFAVLGGGRAAWTGPWFFAVSPVLVHGTVLGRPDHQSLLVFLVALALGAEWMLVRRKERSASWAGMGGCAFGMALWVSWYEPLVLLGLTVVAWLVAAPVRFFSRERVWWIAGIAGVLGCAFMVEGTGFLGLGRLHDARQNWEFLKRWGGTIGELEGIGMRQVFGWLGWSLLLGPVVCGVRMKNRWTWAMAGATGVLLGLTLWQARWGYFLALGWALVLPEVFASFKRAWVACMVFLASLWPVAWEWDARLDPEGALAGQRMERLREAWLLRQMAETIRAEGGGVFLAPWWHSPALAYWSGAPGVAGSSHESIGGIVDASRFYLAAEHKDASDSVLKERGVRWVLSDDPGRLEASASTILGAQTPSRSLAYRLMRESGGVSGLRLRAQNDFFKLFEVEPVRVVP
jgi:hypothetical protein